MKWILADWGENKRHIFDAVSSSLRAYGHDCFSVPRNDMARRSELLEAISGGEYDALLTWQRFYPMQRDLIDAVENSAISTVYMDFGFIPHYGTVVFDMQGENATSTWPEIWNHAIEKPSQYFLDEADHLMREETARARTMSIPEVPEIQILQFPFVFVPLQRPNDSVVRYDSEVHDFGRFVRRILYLAMGRFFVVIKTHPLDRDLDLGIPASILGSHLLLNRDFGAENEPLCDFLLSRAALVASINSNMLFRALVLGTSALAAGRGWFSRSKAISETEDFGTLASLRTGLPDLEAQRRYIAMCLSRQLTFDALSDLEKCADVFERIGISIRCSEVPT
ncbi:MAG: hypothetical protein IIA14_03230 [SAR324 cluster bacterium]|nr:hypothetical protein [SAR324 cluster bacterium]